MRERIVTLDELAASLPSGLHDAKLLSLAIDYPRQRLTLDLRINVGDPDAPDTAAREARRPVRMCFTGLLRCVVDPPDSRYPFDRAGPLTIDAGDGEPATSPRELPPVPPGAFLSWIFVYEWNAFLRVVARGVQIEEPPRGDEAVTPP